MIRIHARRLLFLALGFMLTLFAAAFVQTAETRAAERFRALEKIGGQVRIADPSSINPYDEGHIVRVSGLATTDEMLADPIFGVRENALLLKRRVETFQWVEIARDGRREYEGQWSEELIDSALFAEPEGHENLSEHRFSPESKIASRVSLGEFEVPLDLIGDIQDREPVLLTSLPGDEWKGTEAELLADGSVFFGIDPDRPIIGDTRVSFEIVPPLQVHLLGRQRGRTLEHFGGRSGPRFLVLKLDRAALFPNIDRTSPLEIWIFRILMVAALAAGLLLLRLTLRTDLRPPLNVVFLFSLSACLAIAADTWRAYSALHASTAVVLALVALLLALARYRQSAASPAEEAAK